MQRFELVEGTSSKFWEVQVTGSDLTVCYGRIGTAGQSKTKNFSDAAAAIKEHDKLIREKTGKGYLPIGGSQLAQASMAATHGVALAAPVAPVAQIAKSTGPILQAVEPASAIAASAERAAQTADPVAAADTTPANNAANAANIAAIVWPSGGFQWKDAWRQELAHVRGIHAPPMESPDVLLSRLLVLPDIRYDWAKRHLEILAQAAGRAWTCWGQAGSKEHITPEALAKPDLEYWIELLAQARCGDSGETSVRWVIGLCAGLHGLSFALDVVMTVKEFIPKGARFNEADVELRNAIACADDASYEAALEVVGRLRQHDPGKKLLCTSLFPHIVEWTLDCIATTPPQDRERLLRTCAMPVEEFMRYLQANPQLFHWNLRSALHLQIAQHGEAAFDAVALVFSKVMNLQYNHSEADLIEIVLHMRVPQQVPLLIGHMENKRIRDALEKLAKHYPAAIIKSAIEHMLTTRSRALEGWTLRLALKEPAALSMALAALDDKTRARFAALLAALQPEEASASRLPPLLREPPWLSKERPLELPAFECSVLPTVQSIEWNETIKRQAAGYMLADYWSRRVFPQDFGITAAGAERLLQGQLLQPGDVETGRFVAADMVFVLPEASRLAFWNSFPVERFGAWADNLGPIGAVLLAYQCDALPGLMNYMKAFPDRAAPLADMIDSPALVDVMIHAMRFSKKHKDHALRWVRKYPRTVLCKALPQAFHPEHSATRDNARHAVRWLVEKGCAEEAGRVAEQYGQRMCDALDALLKTDPLFMLPGVMPKLPAFFVAASFRRPELAAGGALPVAAMEYIGSMLAISQTDAPYPGLAIVKDSCTRTSLAEFAWDIFEAWLAAGASGKDGFAFKALALLGDDQTARRLAPLIRAWPEQSAQARALAGLDVLAAIGSDVALMYLSGLARAKNKPLQKRATAMVDAVAEARGLSSDELADRLVPNLGLDEAGALELDFGPRKFHLRFDETLEPFVNDAQGVRMKTLPRQVKTDDPALAAPAVERFKQMRKEARATASLQVARMERAMVAHRRWPAADFRLFFLEHPLMRHLTARVVWGVYEESRLVQGFRVAEDWTLADADDTHYVLPDGASIGIPHILEMPANARSAFLQIFGDYEIAQPFKQLGRETYSLTADELQGNTITRFKDKVVYIGSIMGLIHRGWERGEAEGGGTVVTYTRPANDGLQIALQIAPGYYIGDMTSEPRQSLPALVLRRSGSAGAGGLLPFNKLDPILASEMLRDLDLLSPAKE